MAKERAIVVGAGGIAGDWFGPLRKEGVQVVAVVDLNIEAAYRRIREYELPAEASTRLGAMLAKHKPDFLVDLTTPESHCRVTCLALEAGVPVLGEKPMAATLPQARAMVRCAERTGCGYMVSQSRRWNARHHVVRKMLTGQAIGDVTTLNCDFYIGAHFGGFRDTMDSPLLLDMAIHHFDLARFLTGLDPRSVYAREFNPKGSWYAGSPAATCVFEMTDNVVFTYRGSWCAEGFHTSWNGDWRFVGSRGTLLFEKDQDPRAEVVAGKEGFHRPLKALTPPKPTLKYQAMHGALREMLAWLRKGTVPQTECHDNLKSLAMVAAALESSRKGRRVSVQGL